VIQAVQLKTSPPRYEYSHSALKSRDGLHLQGNDLRVVLPQPVAALERLHANNAIDEVEYVIHFSAQCESEWKVSRAATVAARQWLRNNLRGFASPMLSSPCSIDIFQL
jgi:hypothetical protein